MRALRRFVTAAAICTLVGSTMTSVTTASATSGVTPTTKTATAPAPVTTHPVPHVLAQRTTTKVHAASNLALRTLTNCGTVDCPPLGYDSVTYQGGPVITTPKVYLVVFSSSPSTLDSATGYIPGLLSATEPNGAGAVNAIVNSAYLDAWAAEYSIPSSNLIIQRGSYAGVITLYNPTLATATSVDDTQISQALNTASYNGQLPAYDANTIFTTFFRSGQVVTINQSGINSITGFCAYHSVTTPWLPDHVTSGQLNYIVMPNESSNAGCNSVSRLASQFDNMTPILAHEIAETITDPTLGAWYNQASGWEIADLCAFSNQISTALPGANYNYYVQYAFSNLGANCIALKPSAVLTASYAAPVDNQAVITTYVANGASPIANATLYLIGPSGTIATQVTDATGHATFSGAPFSDVSIFYAGNAAVAGLSASPGSPPPVGPTLTSVTSQPSAIAATWKAPSSLGDKPLSFYTATASPGANYCTTATLSCVITGLQNGTTYSVTVTASTSAGYSPNSNALTTTPASTPQPPTDVTATRGDTKVGLTWAAPVDTGGLALTGYSIVVQTFPLASTKYHFTTGANATSFTVTGLQDGIDYCYKVSAVNALGASISSDDCMTPQVFPSPPGSPTATPAAQSVVVSWTPASQRTGGAIILGYTATANPGGQSCTTATLTCTITGLYSGVTYSISVVTFSGYGTSDPATTGPVVPIGPPTPPSTVTLSALNNALLVKWSPTHATSYTATATDGVSVFSCTATTTSCVIAGLQNGTSYNVSVTATNTEGTSSPSATSTSAPAAVFTWTLSAAPTALVGTTTPVTLRLNAGLPASTLPAAGTTVTLLVNAVAYQGTLNARGVAVFSPTIAAGTNLLDVTLSAGVSAAAPSSSLRITGLYGFGGFVASTLSVGSGSIWFSLSNATGPLAPATSYTLAATAQIGLRFSGSGQTLVQPCSYTSKYFACTNVVPSGMRTLTAVQLVNGVWTPVTALAGIATQVQYGATMTPGHTLAVGQALISSNGAYHAYLTSAGIFIVTGPHGVIWRSSTRATNARRAWFQGTGRFVLASPSSGRVYFASRGIGTRLILQNDGNLVLYNGTRATWATR